MSNFTRVSNYLDKYELSQKLLQFVYDRLMEADNWQRPTQNDLADEIGVSQPMISGVKSGKKFFAIDTYKRYSDKRRMEFDVIMREVLQTDISTDLQLTTSPGFVGPSRVKEMVSSIEDHLIDLQTRKSVRADFDGILRVLSQIVEVGQGAIFLRRPNTDEFHTAASLKPQCWSGDDRFYRPGEGVTGWILKNRRVVRVADLRERKELQAIHPPDPPIWKQKSCRVNCDIGRSGYAFLGAPICKGTEVFGVIRLIDVDNDRRFSNSDEEVLVHVAGRVADLFYTAIRTDIDIDTVFLCMQHDSETRRLYLPSTYLSLEAR